MPKSEPLDSSAPARAEGVRDEPTDATLVADALAGHSAASRRIYERYAPAVAGRLRRILGRREDVEDVLQMTFLEVHRVLSRFDRARPLGPWIHGIAMRVTSTFLRARRRKWWQLTGVEAEALPEAVSATKSAEDQVIVDEAARLIWSEVQKLPPEKRIAFTLYELEQRTVGEIAELTGASPQTTWARIQSARERVMKRVAVLRKDGER
jgi:RNA polymerase sigma-70 factor, ECF subfamily